MESRGNVVTLVPKEKKAKRAQRAERVSKVFVASMVLMALKEKRVKMVKGANVVLRESMVQLAPEEKMVQLDYKVKRVLKVDRALRVNRAFKVSRVNRGLLAPMARMEKRESVVFQGKMARMDLTARMDFRVQLAPEEKMERTVKLACRASREKPDLEENRDYEE
jgi:hypothetical protein